MNQNKKKFITIASAQDLRILIEGTTVFPLDKAILRDKWLFGTDFKLLFLTPELFLSPLSETQFFSFFFCILRINWNTYLSNFMLISLQVAAGVKVFLLRRF